MSSTLYKMPLLANQLKNIPKFPNFSQLLATPQTEIVFKANQLNQFFNDHWFSFPIRWNAKARSWFIIPVETGHIHKFYIQVFLIYSYVFIGFSLIYFLIFQNTHKLAPHLLSIYFLETAIFAVGISIHLICFLDAEELVLVCNWSYKKEEIWLVDDSTRGKSQYRLISGIIALSLTLWSTLVPFQCALFLTVANIDPYYLSMLLLDVPPNIRNNPGVTLLRLASMLHLSQLAAVSLRTVGMVATNIGISRSWLLKLLTTCNPTQDCIQLYREMLVTSGVMKKFERKITATALACVFVFVVMGVAIGFVGIRVKKDNTLALPAIGMAGVALVFLQLLFLVGCSLYNYSTEVLHNWKEIVGLSKNGKEKREMKKVVKSLKILAIPVGEVGIIDQDIKINYMDNLQGNIVDVLVTANNMFE